MKGILVLAGSGEFTPAMEEPDKYILKSSGAKKVAIIPTAAGKEAGWTKWVDDGMAHFKKLGVNAFGIAVLNKKDANDVAKFRDLKNADFIYFSGGDPGHLFYSLKNSLFWDEILKLHKNGVVLAGCSAGAMIMGRYVLSNVYAIEAGEKTKWEKGFEMVESSIIPHFDYIIKKEKNMYERIINETPDIVKKTLMGIDENTALILEKTGSKVIGKGKVHDSL